MTASPPQRTGTGDGGNSSTVLSVRAYAKVNLSLEILGRRPDGFHEIVSVTQIISLADTVEARAAESLAVKMKPPLVDGAENLVGVAARTLAAEMGRTPTGLLHVMKRVPLAAGLGGGSSDAAATLRLLARLWNIRLNQDRLAALAANLGSDVPLFLGGGTSLIRGRGEVVEPLAPARRFWLMLVCPNGAPAEKTRALYGALSRDEYGSGATTLALASRISEQKAVVGEAFVNSFDGAASRVYPGFAELRAALQEAIGQPVHLTGAGPTLFATFASRAETRRAVDRVSNLGLSALLAQSIARRPVITVRAESASAPTRS